MAGPASYLHALSELDQQLAGLDPAALDTPGRRGTLAGAAHTLAGHALSVGAVRLGAMSRALEHAALDEEPAILSAFCARIRGELQHIRAAISAERTTKGPDDRH
jgi:hypothetical protein